MQHQKSGFQNQGSPEEAIRLVCDAIVRARGTNIPSVHHFFAPYDCYESRIFELEELSIIFEDTVDP